MHWTYIYFQRMNIPSIPHNVKQLPPAYDTIIKYYLTSLCKHYSYSIYVRTEYSCHHITQHRPKFNWTNSHMHIIRLKALCVHDLILRPRSCKWLIQKKMFAYDKCTKGKRFFVFSRLQWFHNMRWSNLTKRIAQCRRGAVHLCGWRYKDRSTEGRSSVVAPASYCRKDM